MKKGINTPEQPESPNSTTHSDASRISDLLRPLRPAITRLIVAIIPTISVVAGFVTGKRILFHWWMLALWLLGLLALVAFEYYVIQQLPRLFTQPIVIRPQVTLMVVLLFFISVPSAVFLAFFSERYPPQNVALTQRGADAITRLEQSGKMTPEIRRDLLSALLRSLMLNDTELDDWRVTVVYMDQSNKWLVMPEHGYDGFDSEISGLRFLVEKQQPGEDNAGYLCRLGVAGWSLMNNKEVIDDDVQASKQGEDHCYKKFDPSEKDAKDHAMMSVPIRKKGLDGNPLVIGVISVSSTSPGTFSEQQKNLIRLFAGLMAREEVPLETPNWMKDKKNSPSKSK